MVSEHAMLILILLLAVAVVVLAVGMMLYVGKLETRLKLIAERLEAPGAALNEALSRASSTK